MGFSRLRFTAIGFALTFAVIRSFGELIVLRSNYNGLAVNFTCLSEDDDGALIWNAWRKPLEEIPHTITDFQPTKPKSNWIGDCAIWNSTECMVKWKNRREWRIVESAQYPMAPVFDYRWEGFKEKVFRDSLRLEKYRLGGPEDTSGTVVFSVRGTGSTFTAVCETGDTNKGHCFWVKKSISDHPESEIWFCENGIPVGETVSNNNNCKLLNSTAQQGSNFPDPYEWKTFTLKWKSDGPTVSLFRETETEPFLKAYNEKWHPDEPHMFVRAQRLLIRFHFYKYLRTHSKDSLISTQEFRLNGKNLCFDVLIGLCPKCEIIFEVESSENEKTDVVTTKYAGNENSMNNDVLTWRSVRVNATFASSGSKLVKLKIRTIFKENKGNGLWALDNIRMRQAVGGLRESTLTIKQRFNGNPRNWVTCQKLLYNKSDVVALTSRNDLSDTGELYEFLRGRKGSCGSKCASFGKGSSICSRDGCICDRGFTGHDCNSECSKGTYGYGCNNICENCLNKNCDKVTGFCKDCVRLHEDFFLPFLCARAAAPGKVQRLRYTFLSDTKVTLQWNPPAQPNGIITHYSVSFKRTKLLGCEDLNRTTPFEVEKIQIVHDTTAYFENLHPYAIYRVTVVAYTSIPEMPEMPEMLDIQTSASDTITSVVSNLRFHTDEQLELKWESPEDCTTITGSAQHHRVIIRGVSHWVRNVTESEQTIQMALPMWLFDPLVPYTQYVVRVYVIRGYHRPENPACYKELSFRTPPKLPPAPTDVKVYKTDRDNNTISVRWKPPYPAHGEIESYYISIEANNQPLQRQTVEVSKNGLICELWKDYVCVDDLRLLRNIPENSKLELKVFVKNKNVQGNGPPLVKAIVLKDLYNEVEPPFNFTYTIRSHGVVTLKWQHPTLKSTKITTFRIKYELLRTKLLVYLAPRFPITLEYPVTDNLEEYTMQLHLLTASTYSVTMDALNARNFSSEPIKINIVVPHSVAFANPEELHVTSAENQMKLTYPVLVNETLDLLITVHVQGPSLCVSHSMPSDEPEVVNDWIVDEYRPGDNRPEYLTIRSTWNQGVKQNCSLRPGESYVVAVFVHDGDSNELISWSSVPVNFFDEGITKYLVLIVAISILTLGALLLFILCRCGKLECRKSSIPSTSKREEALPEVHYYEEVRRFSSKIVPHTYSNSIASGRYENI